MEKEKKVCPACEQGFMVYTLAHTEGFPPQYRHNCERCAFEDYYYEVYEKEETPSGDSTISEPALHQMANELIAKFDFLATYSWAIKCAIIAIEDSLELDLPQHEEDKQKRLLGFLTMKLYEEENTVCATSH